MAKILGASPFSHDVVSLTEWQRAWVVEQAYLDLPESERKKDTVDKDVERKYQETFGAA